MRTISIEELEEVFDEINGAGSFADWQIKADEHLKEIRNSLPTERSRYWSAHNYWRELYPALSKLSKHKCWYSEAPENSSEWEVEHYRPKAKSLSERKDANGKSIILRDNGYWWLSYNWRNFRLAGSLVNKLRRDRFEENSDVYGKGSFFPLTEDSEIAQPEDAYCDCEVTLLLDPVNPRDCTLISFDSNGDVFPTYNDEEDPHLFLKANLSIKYYGLYHTPIIRGRKKVWQQCDDVVEKTRNFLFTYRDKKNEIEKKINECYRKLAALGSKKSPYSMVVTSFVREKTQDEENYSWLKNALIILQ